MTVLDNVRDLIVRRNGEPICDDCIAEKMKITPRQHANRKTNIIKNEPGFDRRKDVCPVCDGNKLVIRRA